MSRLSFEKKRAQPPAAHPAVVSVRVFGAGTASVGGSSVVAAAGEEIQQAVLDHLQRLAISLGAPIRATIQDDCAGCVVPLEVSADGSSRVTGEPVRVPAATGRNMPSPGAAEVVPSVAVPGEAHAVPPLAAPKAPDAVPFVAVPAPTGTFGPAPVMALSAPAVDVAAPVAVVPAQVAPHDLFGAVADPAPATTATPTPPRGFDAVAEEVLGDGPLTETAEGAELLTGPMTRINEAVRAGRIDTAAQLVDRTVGEASAVLGPRHPEVLHLQELAAYIAYLAGDPVRAFRLSLESARARRSARDAEAAYGDVQSAATAWRAVRDPEEGLRMGHDLIDLWTDLTAEPGPAADDLRPLESARARMVRLTDRAARAAQA